jgi:hypothetical protein
MSLHSRTVTAFLQTLVAAEGWLAEAEAWAEDRGFEADVLLDARLFPDQFSLRRNLQSMCDTAKLTPARVAQVEAPKHEDGPQTLAELKARIADVKAWLESLDPAAFEGREDELLAPAFLRGGRVRVDDFVRGWGLPNFYFHAVTSYSILRSQGVKLGKRAYIGSMPILPPEDEG